MEGLPSKELVEMIEQRIPGGKYLTTTALMLVIIALIVASSIYLYHALVLPSVALISSGLSSTKVSISTIGNLLASIVGMALLVLSSQYFSQKTMGLVHRVTDMFEEVSKDEKKLNEAVDQLKTAVRFLDARISRLENPKQ